MRDECCQQKNDLLQWHIPATGIYAYAEVIGISADVLVNRLSKQGVLASSINNSYIDNAQHPEGLHICVCNTDDNTIRSAVKLIEQEAKSLK
jgi:DNA-binding transcriptional MocR family regulator